jgi:hypothetical protein
MPPLALQLCPDHKASFAGSNDVGVDSFDVLGGSGVASRSRNSGGGLGHVGGKSKSQSAAGDVTEEVGGPAAQAVDAAFEWAEGQLGLGETGSGGRRAWGNAAAGAALMAAGVCTWALRKVCFRMRRDLLPPSDARTLRAERRLRRRLRHAMADQDTQRAGRRERQEEVPQPPSRSPTPSGHKVKKEKKTERGSSMNKPLLKTFNAATHPPPLLLQEWTPRKF